MFDSTHQNLTVTTFNDDFPNQTRCNIKNEEGEWISVPNIAVSIHRDGNIMVINCENDKQSGISNLDSDFQGEFLVLDLILDLCIISCWVDGISNSFYEYPSVVTVPMNDK